MGDEAYQAFVPIENEEERNDSMLSEKNAPDKTNTLTKLDTGNKSLWQRIAKSFTDSIGDIVFGMEDGTVSIFGLVFGVASSTTSSSAALLAGATAAALAGFLIGKLVTR